jgi:hypothetical protein
VFITARCSTLQGVQHCKVFITARCSTIQGVQHCQVFNSDRRVLQLVLLLTERKQVFGELHSKTPPVRKHKCMQRDQKAMRGCQQLKQDVPPSADISTFDAAAGHTSLRLTIQQWSKKE